MEDMKIIYLPGKSLKNKVEAEDIVAALEGMGYQTYLHQWRHWSNEAEPMALQVELGRIASQITILDTELVIIGKSFGSFVALKLINKYHSLITKVILLGIPVNDFDNPKELNEYPQTLQKLNVPVIVFQNKKDPHGNPEQVKELLEGVKYRLIEKDANDHIYSYLKDILNIISQ